MKGGGVNEGVVGAVWLIGIAASYADRGMSAELGARNLTVPACGILLALYGDRTVMTFQFLRELLGIDKNAMVGIVDDLEQRGWVRRSRSTADRRVHMLSLTRDGMQFVCGELLDLIRQLDHALSTPLTESDRERLCTTLAQAVGIRIRRYRYNTGGSHEQD